MIIIKYNYIEVVAFNKFTHWFFPFILCENLLNCIRKNFNMID